MPVDPPGSRQDRSPVPHRSLRIVGLVLAAIGGLALVVAAFLPWFTVTATLPAIPGLPSELTATVTGTGAVSMDSIGGTDASSSVPVGAAWAGWTVFALAAAAVALAGVAGFASASTARVCASVAAACGLGAAGIGVYALLVPVGRQTVSEQGVSLDVETSAAAGPYIVFGGAALVLAGALTLLLARRSPAPASAAPAQYARPVPPLAPRPAQQTGPPVPQRADQQRAWARPVEPSPAPSNPVPIPPSNPAPAHHLDTAVSPVSQRRPRPDWDRDWPTLVPTPPAPPTPSQQDTVVVKRPPRPVRVSPNPEPRRPPRSEQAPNFDGPTQPL